MIKLGIDLSFLRARLDQASGNILLPIFEEALESSNADIAQLKGEIKGLAEQLAER